MKPAILHTLRSLTRTRRRRLALLLASTDGLVLLAGPPAGGNHVYSNIGPAPQLPAGGLVGRYPLADYPLDQYFPGISVHVFSSVDVSGVPPLIAFLIAQIIWLITAFMANAVIALFAFAFNPVRATRPRADRGSRHARSRRASRTIVKIVVKPGRTSGLESSPGNKSEGDSQ